MSKQPEVSSSRADSSGSGDEMNGSTGEEETASERTPESVVNEANVNITGSSSHSGGRMTTSTPIDRSREGSEQPQSSVFNSQRSDMFGLAAPKYGTLVPNRIFVGGISTQTTEEELHQLFSQFGSVRGTKIIMDRAGVSKGYGFVTFETEEEAKRLYIAITNKDIEPIVHRERRLNIAPAVKKQPTGRHDIPFSGNVEANSPNFAGASFYFSQAQAAQYYSQPAAIQEPYFAHPNTTFTPSMPPQAAMQPFYSASAPQPSGPVYYLPQQYQTYQPGQWSTTASGSNINVNLNGQCQWRWVTPAHATATPLPQNSIQAFSPHTTHSHNQHMHHHPLNHHAASFTSAEHIYLINPTLIPPPH